MNDECSNVRLLDGDTQLNNKLTTAPSDDELRTVTMMNESSLTMNKGLQLVCKFIYDQRTKIDE